MTDPRITSAENLFAEYVRHGSEAAFRELVSRYLDLVYSAACRLVDGDRHLAEDVAQTVFADLARKARSLRSGVMLGGWLHRHTCFVARTLMRSERRRQLRERLVVEMNSMDDHSTENLAALTPVLDDAINALGAEDRAAILLRFFEQRDFRGVAQVLGTNDDTARKRVARAVEKLNGLLQQRGVALSGAALAAALPGVAVSAAPAGLVAAISTAAVASAAAGGSGAAFTFFQLMSMTKVQVGIASGLLLAVVIPLAIEHQAKQELLGENAALRQTARELELLTAENQRLAGLVVSGPSLAAPRAQTPAEVLRLRGQVGVLRGQLANAARSGAGSALTANPEMLRLIREQEIEGMKSVYKTFAAQAKLSEAQLSQLVEMLVDHFIATLEAIAVGMGEGRNTAQMSRMVQEREAALLAQFETAFGPAMVPPFRDFTRDLSSLTTEEEFREELKGEEAAAKANGIVRVMREETSRALAARQLPADFQTAPKLNLLNLVSEVEAGRSLQLLEEVFVRTAERSADFLTAEEVELFQQYTARVLKNNASGIALNRAMITPLPPTAQP